MFSSVDTRLRSQHDSHLRVHGSCLDISKVIMTAYRFSMVKNDFGRELPENLLNREVVSTSSQITKGRYLNDLAADCISCNAFFECTARRGVGYEGSYCLPVHFRH